MSTLLSRSNAWMESAKNAMSRIRENDAFMDCACFNIQQAIEFLLKYELDTIKVKYGETHNIMELVRLFKNSKYDLSTIENLFMMADTITEWEFNIRNGKDIIVTRRRIVMACTIYYDLLDLFQGRTKNDDNNDNPDNPY